MKFGGHAPDPEQEASPSHTPERGRARIFLALLAVTSLGVSLFVVGTEVWLDDPYIGFRYAANLERGLGLVYNPGEAVEGYTAWLWVMFAWIPAVLDIDPLVFTQWVNGASQVAVLFVLFRLGEREGRSPFCALVAPALVALHLANVGWSMLGLSANFLMLLVTLAVTQLALRVQRTAGRSVVLGAVLLLIALTRFDGLVLALVVLGYALVVDRQVTRTVPALAVVIFGLVIFNAWRYVYYGQPFPNTFYAKQSTFAEEFAGGTRYVVDFFRNGGPYGLLTLGIPFVAGGKLLLAVLCLPLLVVLCPPRRDRPFPERRTAVAAWTAAGHLGYVTLIGGDWMIDYRFILPVLPCLAFLLQEALWGAARLIPGGPLPRRAVAGLAIVGLVAWNLMPLADSPWRDGSRREKRPGAYWNAPDARVIGQHLSNALPPDALIAVEWAGIIPYYVRQPVFDIFGLNDADIMAQDFPGSRMGRAITPEYLVERDPEAVIVVARLFDSEEAARAGIDLRPDGSWIASFFDTLRGPEFGFEVAVTQVDENHWYPFLVKPGWDWRVRDEQAD